MAPNSLPFFSLVGREDKQLKEEQIMATIRELAKKAADAVHELQGELLKKVEIDPFNADYNFASMTYNQLLLIGSREEYN